MPVPDPVPSPSASLKRRFWRIFRLLVLLSLVVAAITVILVGRGDDSGDINMLIAAGLGAGLTTLLGTSLMTLVFLSADSGHDAAAADQIQYKEKE